jgi:fatty acid desaturase
MQKTRLKLSPNISDIKSEAVFENSWETRQRVTQIFTKDEIRDLTQRSDLMGAWAIIMTWGGVALIMTAMVYAASEPPWVAIPGIILGMLFLAGRQLSLSIIVHDASHGTLFKTKWMNHRLTDWLCARPLWNDLQKYRPYHFVHHTRTATEDDPDLILRQGYPTHRASLIRKFIRDLSGIVGFKYLIGRVMMDAGLLNWTVTGEVKWLPRENASVTHYLLNFIKTASPMMVTNILLFSLLYALGYGWLYACWVGAHLTFFMMFMRIRSMAEHAACARNLNMFENTRSMKAGWFARATVAPIGVNYHMEHHILASCPWFRLAKAHQILRQRNAVPEALSYLQVLKLMSSATIKPVRTTG